MSFLIIQRLFVPPFGYMFLYNSHEVRLERLFDLNDQAEDLGDKIQQHKHDLKK
jgi:hypothetical protein